MKETEPMNNLNLMVWGTERRLRIDLRKVKEDLYTAGQNLGDAFGQTMTGTIVPQLTLRRRIGTREAELQAALRNVKIIEPRQEIDDVGLENAIIVKNGRF